MLINSQLVKDHFGQYYKIQTSKDKPAPGALESELFRSNSQAKSFIDNLKAPVSFWSKIYHSESLIAETVLNDNHLKTQVAELFHKGKIKAFKIDVPSLSEHPPEKRTVQDGSKNNHTFTTASTLLISSPKEVKQFTNKADAEKYLSEISADEEQLKSIASELDLSADDISSVNLTDVVATALASGALIVIVDRYSAPPSSGGDEAGVVHGDKDASKGPETPECSFDAMTIECSHFGKGRNYKLDVIKDKPNLNGVDKALQVIAKPGDPDEITVTYSGSCANGSKECPAIKIDSKTLSGTFTDNPYKFKALPLEDEREPDNFMDFLKHYLVPDLSGLKYQTYSIEKSGCNGSEGKIAKVHAFPTFKWGGNVEFGYYEKNPNKEKDPNKLKETAELKLLAKINGNLSKKNWAFETSKSNDTNKYFPDIHEKVDGLVKRIDKFKTMKNQDEDIDVGLVNLNIGWPNISIGGNIELKEATNDFDVDVGGDLSLAFSPLIKADLKTDILDWFVSLVGGPFGEFLRRVKIQAAKGIGTKKFNAKAILALEVIVNGSLSAELKWEKTAKEKWLSTVGNKTGSASLGLTIGLVGVIKGETQIFRVKITIGAEFHLKGARNSSEGIGGIVTLFATTAKDKPAIGGKFEFTGAALYYTYYAEVGSAEIESERTSDASSGRKKSGLASQASQTSSSESKLKEDRLEKFHEFFAPFEIPRKNSIDKPIPISDFDL